MSTHLKNIIYCWVFLLYSCASTALYDQQSFDKAINAKVETLSLINKSNEDYAEHEGKVDDLLLELQKIYEYDKRRSNNQLTTRMWDVMLDENRNLVAGYFKKWKTGGPQNQVFIDEVAIQLEQAFDLLLDFESAKNKTESNEFGNLLHAFLSTI